MNQFVETVLQKLSPLGEITARAMMGGYCMYLNGTLFGSICGEKDADTLFLKIFPQNEEFLSACEKRPPYDGAKPLFVVDITDDEFLRQAVYLTFLGATHKTCAAKRRFNFKNRTRNLKKL